MVSSVNGVGISGPTLLSVKSSTPTTTVIVADNQVSSLVPSSLTLNLMTGYEYLQKLGMWLAMFSAMALPSFYKNIARSAVRVPLDVVTRSAIGLVFAEAFNLVTSWIGNRLWRS